MRKLVWTLCLLMILLCGCSAGEETVPLGEPLSEQWSPPEPEQSAETVIVEEPPEAEPEEETEPLPDVDTDSWELILANAENSIEEYAPVLSEVEGMLVDERIVGPLTEFMEAARAEGLSVYLSSAYRSYDEQTYLYNRKVEQYGSEEEAAAIVAPPRHQRAPDGPGMRHYRPVLRAEKQQPGRYGPLPMDEPALPGIRLHRPLSQG